MVVVATTDQVTRARLRFDRCFGGTISVVAAAEPQEMRSFAFTYEWGAIIKAETVQRSC